MHKPDDCCKKDKDKSDAEDEETPENGGRATVTVFVATASKITQVNKFEFVCFPTVVSDDEESTISEGDTTSEHSCRIDKLV